MDALIPNAKLAHYSTMVIIDFDVGLDALLLTWSKPFDRNILIWLMTPPSGSPPVEQVF
jgi:hypothetical protein